MLTSIIVILTNVMLQSFFHINGCSNFEFLLLLIKSVKKYWISIKFLTRASNYYNIRKILCPKNHFTLNRLFDM